MRRHYWWIIVRICWLTQTKSAVRASCGFIGNRPQEMSKYEADYQSATRNDVKMIFHCGQHWGCSLHWVNMDPSEAITTRQFYLLKKAHRLSYGSFISVIFNQMTSAQALALKTCPCNWFFYGGDETLGDILWYGALKYPTKILDNVSIKDVPSDISDIILTSSHFVKVKRISLEIW